MKATMHCMQLNKTGASILRAMDFNIKGILTYLSSNSAKGSQL